LSGRRVADEGDIRHYLELEDDVALPAGGAEQCEAGRLAPGVRERGVAEAALATGRRDEPHARLGKVGQLSAVGILHDRPNRNRENEGWRAEAAAVVAHAWAAVVRPAVRGT